MGISSEDTTSDLYEDSSSNSVNSSSNAPKFSEITNSQSGRGTVKMGGKMLGTVSKKIFQKNQAKIEAANPGNGAFTVSEIEDGKRSVRHLQGRRQSANILFVPKKIEDNPDEYDGSNYMENQRQLFKQVIYFLLFVPLFVTLLNSILYRELIKNQFSRLKNLKTQETIVLI